MLSLPLRMCFYHQLFLLSAVHRFSWLLFAAPSVSPSHRNTHITTVSPLYTVTHVLLVSHLHTFIHITVFHTYTDIQCISSITTMFLGSPSPSYTCISTTVFPSHSYTLIHISLHCLSFVQLYTYNTKMSSFYTVV